MHENKLGIRVIFIALLILFAAFLIYPLIILTIRSLETNQEFGFVNYLEAIRNPELLQAFINSMKVSGVSAFITTILAFILSYTIHGTRIYKSIKRFIRIGILIPMLLPTITYGFAIMYTLGKQGLLTKLLGKPLFDIYGFNGLLIGYVIFTLPAAFILINNSFMYIDKKFIIISKLMGDGVIRSFINTIFRPLGGVLASTFVISFILSFTDFGIPASLDGTYTVVSTQLYQVMLGSIPNFSEGSVIAILMLLPAIVSVLLLSYLERFNFHYDKISDTELIPNKMRDISCGILSSIIVVAMCSIFLIIFIAPFLTSYPFNNTFTFKHVTAVLESSDLTRVYKNSVFVAITTAICGTIITFCAALINARTKTKGKKLFDVIALMTNTVPGMVLALGYLVLFNGSSLKGTFLILIIYNIVHYFTTPYFMIKNAFMKMNPSWETTGALLGDSWIKTIYRVILPNSKSSILEMFSFYFINSMVSVSGIIFLTTAKTSLITSKIKELQHFAKFNEIFVLSLFIFFTNLFVKLACEYLQKRELVKKPQKYKVKVRDIHVQKI